MENISGTTERNPTNQDILSGQWKQMRGTLRSWWGKLTDNDLDRIAGQKDRLIGLLQEKYGYARDMAEREVERRLKEYGEHTGSFGNSGATENLGQAAEDTTQDMYQKASAAASDVKAKAQEIGSDIAKKASSVVTTAGEKMGSLAGTIRQNAPQEGTMGSAATAVADKLEATSSYLQHNSFENMGRDLTELIRRYPIQSLLVGVGIGYLLTRRPER